MDTAPLRDIGHDADAAPGGYRFEPFVEVGSRHDPARPVTGWPGPRSGSAAHRVDDKGPAGRVVPVKLAGVGQAVAGGAGGDPGLVEEVHDAQVPRSGDLPADERHVDPALAEGGERVIAPDEADRVSGLTFEAGDGVLGPRIGQQPAEPETDDGVLADRGDAGVKMIEYPRRIREEFLPGRRQRDGMGVAVDEVRA